MPHNENTAFRAMRAVSEPTNAFSESTSATRSVSVIPQKTATDEKNRYLYV